MVHCKNLYSVYPSPPQLCWKTISWPDAVTSWCLVITISLPGNQRRREATASGHEQFQLINRNYYIAFCVQIKQMGCKVLKGNSGIFKLGPSLHIFGCVNGSYLPKVLELVL